MLIWNNTVAVMQKRENIAENPRRVSPVSNKTYWSSALEENGRDREIRSRKNGISV